LPAANVPVCETSADTVPTASKITLTVPPGVPRLEPPMEKDSAPVGVNTVGFIELTVGGPTCVLT